MADNQLYEVEQIFGKKRLPQGVFYLVRWRGFSPEHDTWEPVKNLKACHLLIDKYNESLSKKTPRDKISVETFEEQKTPSEKSCTERSNVDASSKKKERKVKIPAVKTPRIKVKPTKLLKNKKRFETSEDKDLLVTVDKVIPEKSKKIDTIKKNKTDQEVDKVKVKGPKKTAVKRKLNSETQIVDNGLEPSKAKKVKSSINNTVDIEKGPENKSLDDDVIVVDDASDEESDDENILYSLNTGCDKDVTVTESLNVLSEKPDKKSKKALKGKNKDVSCSVVVNETESSSESAPVAGKKKKSKKSMSLMNSKKDLVDKSGLLRSVSPPPTFFTAVKDISGDVGTTDPSKPPGESLLDPVSPEASETFLADVPSSYSLTAEEPDLDEEPLSPGSISYKTFLDSLPSGYLPDQSNKPGRPKKGSSKVVNGAGNGGALLGSGFASTVGREPVERRTSVRTTECAFRYKQIVVKKCLRYTQIWLNPQTVMQNALNPQVIQEIVSALNSAKYDDSHLVLFSSLGNVFCSGTDLHFLVSGDRRMAARQMADSIRELTKTFISFPKPIIAAVSGAAVGLGVSLLALCDIVYASDKASFHLPYSQLSQTPEGCSSFTLPLTLGLPSANELLFGGRKITAMEAYQLGLVSQVFWPTLMMQEVIPRAQKMAICSAKALEATKLLIRSHHRTKMELTNETECNLLLERWSSVDCQQAIETYIGNEKNFSF